MSCFRWLSIHKLYILVAWFNQDWFILLGDWVLIGIRCFIDILVVRSKSLQIFVLHRILAVRSEVFVVHPEHNWDRQLVLEDVGEKLEQIYEGVVRADVVVVRAFDSESEPVIIGEVRNKILWKLQQKAEAEDQHHHDHLFAFAIG